MKTNEERLNELLAHLDSLDHIHVDEIPQIDLYMDQVTTFMEKHLGELKRYPEDKVLTKTMINNYAKNNLLPSPVKKKYTQEHILLLVFIYYFKNIQFVPYFKPGSYELASNTAICFENKDVNACFLSNHGFVLGAKNIKEAFNLTVMAENVAQIELNAQLLGSLKTLDEF